jgi:hypothetical protein
MGKKMAKVSTNLHRAIFTKVFSSKTNLMAKETSPSRKENTQAIFN